jgi:serine/threonine protein kinase
MGVVFAAEEERDGLAVALKMMRPDIIADAGARQRFVREARAAAIRHEHIVAIHRVGVANGAPYLAMELLQGESLADRVERDGVLPPLEAVRIGKETARGLWAAHETGLIHRDVKPANLWLESPRGRVKVLDFGLARGGEDEPGLTHHGAPIGTPAFMSPEQALGKPVDHRADLFSLGATLYRLLTGRLPFTGRTTGAMFASLLEDDPPPVHELNPAVPPTLASLVHRLLAKSPLQRPASALVVARELIAMEKTPAGWLDRCVTSGGNC